MLNYTYARVDERLRSHDQIDGDHSPCDPGFRLNPEAVHPGTNLTSTPMKTRIGTAMPTIGARPESRVDPCSE